MVVFAACLGYGFQQSEWREFQLPSGGFTVSLPGEPRSLTQTSDMASAQGNNRVFTLEAEGINYIITDSELTLDLTDARAIQAALDNGRDQAVTGSGGTLESERNITLGGYAGREMRVKLAGEYLRARAYVANRRLYQLIVVTSPSLVDSPSVTRFFCSFRLR